jgi:hypothetical protein
MSVETIVYSVLSGAAGVTSLVPVARIKVAGGGDYQAIDKPYITHRSVTKTRTYTHSAESTRIMVFHQNYQISVVADSVQTALAISNAVETAMDNGTNGNFPGAQFFLTVREILPYDGERKLQEIALDYRVAEFFS